MDLEKFHELLGMEKGTYSKDKDTAHEGSPIIKTQLLYTTRWVK